MMQWFKTIAINKYIKNVKAMKCNIAISLPDDIRDKAIKMSTLVAKNGGIFILGTQNNFPHITIAHFECYSVKDLDNVVRELEVTLNNIRSFDVNQFKHRINSGWVDVSFKLNKNILSVYEAVLQILKRNNCTKTSDDWNNNLPHITFSKFDSSEDFDIEALPKYDFSFIVDRIGVFELGDYGTNKKLLKQFSLK